MASLSSTRSALYRLACLLGDVQAVRNGTIAKRLERRILGKMTGRLLRRITK